MEDLAAMKEKVAAMAAMAEVSQLQLTLADNIKTSMARIDATMAGEASPQGQDAEVEAWRRKIE